MSAGLRNLPYGSEITVCSQKEVFCPQDQMPEAITYCLGPPNMEAIGCLKGHILVEGKVVSLEQKWIFPECIFLEYCIKDLYPKLRFLRS